MASKRRGYLPGPVATSPRRALLAVGALCDLGLGLWWLLVPGLWQELVHPWALGEAFWWLHAAGALRLARFGLGVVVWRRVAWLAYASATPAAGAVAVLRPGALGAAALAGSWGLECPGALLLAWQVGDAGPMARIVHVAAGLLAVLWAHNALVIARRAGPQPRLVAAPGVP